MTVLFEKDLRLILIKKSVIYLYLIIGAIFSWQFSISFSVGYLTMLGTMFALSTLGYDDSDNCMEFIFTLPCTRRQFVMEKYLFVYGFSFVSGLTGVIIAAIASLIKGAPVDPVTFIGAVASEFPIFVIIGGIMIPLQLKFGLEKTRMVLILFIGIVCVTGFTISRIPGIKNILASAGNILNSINLFGLLIISAIILIILSMISIFISMRIASGKEF